MPPPGSGTTVSEDMEFHMARFLSQEQKSRSPRRHTLHTIALSHALAAAVLKAPATKAITLPNEQKLDLVNDSVVEPPIESMEHFQVRALPKQGLFVDDVHEGLSNAPLRVRYEVCRVALANGIQPYNVMSTYKGRYGSQSALANYFKSHPLLSKVPKPSSSKAWIAAGKNFENVTLKGKLSINTVKEGPLFRMTLEPLQIEQSCRFQREFGGDRFLYIDVPSLSESDLPSHLKQQRNLKRRLREWLQLDHRFLGRSWRALMLEDRKRKKKFNQQDPDRGQRIILFATSDCDSTGSELLNANKPETSIGELIDWFLCVKRNSHQPFPKAYARLELGLSRTHPSLVFLPSQIRRIKDVHADGTPEATCFNDQSLHWEDIHDPETVMNDGCAQMSVGAAFEIWRSLGKPGPVPSVFQGRIAGAKGLWMISAPTYEEHPGHREIWIQISDSQNKFEPHTEDLSDELYNKNRLTFEVLTHSKQPRSAALHVSFIPILLDRGVPREQLKRLVADYLDYERQQLMENVADPVWLRKWINEQNSLAEERNRQGDIVWQAGLPLNPVEKAILLLESGFTPTSNQFLADSVQWLVEQYLLKLKTRLTVPLGRSSNLWGIADPYNTLLPGEVHLNFSTNFLDEKSGEVYPLLNGREVLVARHPALRRSDIQKVQAVFKPELSHLTDVIIFSAKGRFPLAAKLQGGDYDGDTFWVCWEPDLVRSFKNAPAPFRSPKPENYGIEVERSKLGELTTGPDTIDSFLERSLAFRSNGSTLGRVTNDHESLSYAKNTIDSPGTNALADLHDLLVDSAKNGYVFDESAYRNYCQKNPHIGKVPAQPAFREYIKKISRRDANPRKPRHKKEHIVDYLLFDIVLPHVEETLVQLKAAFAGGGTSDPDLPALYLEEKGAAAQAGTAPDEAGPRSKALKALKDDLAKIRQGFNEQYGRSKRSGTTGSDGYSQNIEQCYQKYVVIEPLNPSNDPTIIRWTKPIVPGAFTYWSLIKASALYHLYDRKLDFVFGLAGRELVYLKACACGRDGVRFLVPRMWANMKPRKIKGGVTEEELLDSEYETAAEEEMEGCDDELF
ncbi:hypothetical protein H2199_006932 [Coniosporium tulheliwenetii]|uniref:Uncharacterized protein n=1 Tax=Coniosporium tulheliwenetii TaxID=3383036 RepID=A0ACC2YSL4_9PEZI|nr:hypothetical protein H2199_006932 [Cladosporium sp. JES 115]